MWLASGSFGIGSPSRAYCPTARAPSGLQWSLWFSVVASASEGLLARQLSSSKALNRLSVVVAVSFLRIQEGPDGECGGLRFTKPHDSSGAELRIIGEVRVHSAQG